MRTSFGGGKFLITFLPSSSTNVSSFQVSKKKIGIIFTRERLLFSSNLTCIEGSRIVKDIRYFSQKNFFFPLLLRLLFDVVRFTFSNPPWIYPATRSDTQKWMKKENRTLRCFQMLIARRCCSACSVL